MRDSKFNYELGLQDLRNNRSKIRNVRLILASYPKVWSFWKVSLRFGPGPTASNGEGGTRIFQTRLCLSRRARGRHVARYFADGQRRRRRRGLGISRPATSSVVISMGWKRLLEGERGNDSALDTSWRQSGAVYVTFLFFSHPDQTFSPLPYRTSLSFRSRVSSKVIRVRMPLLRPQLLSKRIDGERESLPRWKIKGIVI